MAETDGQVSEGTPTTVTGSETTQAAPESQTTSPQTSTSAPATAEETFFDPESIKGKPELEAAYKQMQAAFTKKTTAFKEHSQKIQAYDSFMQNPAQALQQLASQYGYSLTRAQAQQMVNDQAQQQNQFEPKSWDEVMQVAEQRAEQRIMQKLSPFLNEVKETRKGQLEKMLDDSCPDWRVYEDGMMQTLQKHPTLVNDPVKLYQLSVPSEVLESRAAQAAMRKLQTKVESAQLSGGSTTTQQASSKPNGKLSFDQAVKFAKAQLASHGMKPPT
ncbi:MAG: hypothetical protein PHE50_00265 [Dehalococcoidales bacterium]|nr:hypothetical protein [Dehalococcoidales bacterium]